MDYAKHTHEIMKRLADLDLPKDIRQAFQTVRRHVKIKMSGRMTRSVGMAEVSYIRAVKCSEVKAELIDLNTLTLKLSSKIIPLMSEEDQEDAITHELAHLCDYVIRGTSNHDVSWRRIHRAFKGSAKRVYSKKVKGLEAIRRPRKRILVVHCLSGQSRIVTQRTWNKLSNAWKKCEEYYIDGKGQRIKDVVRSGR